MYLHLIKIRLNVVDGVNHNTANVKVHKEEEKDTESEHVM